MAFSPGYKSLGSARNPTGRQNINPTCSVLKRKSHPTNYILFRILRILEFYISLEGRGLGGRGEEVIDVNKNQEISWLAGFHPETRIILDVEFGV